LPLGALVADRSEVGLSSRRCEAAARQRQLWINRKAIRIAEPFWRALEYNGLVAPHLVAYTRSNSRAGSIGNPIQTLTPQQKRSDR